MNFNYSYRAFLIASLLVGNLVLLMYGVKLKKEISIPAKEYDVEISAEDLLTEEELQEMTAVKKTQVITHKTTNEAEKFISELEDQRDEPSQDILDKLNQMNKAIARSERKPMPEIDRELSEKIDKALENKPKTVQGNNRNSTNSFNLKDRQALDFPNPIYTCEGFGKVFLDIEVNAQGRVIKAHYNKQKSTTTNMCLIESAIAYAKKARFTTAANQPSQTGSISYIFPGQ